MTVEAEKDSKTLEAKVAQLAVGAFLYNLTKEKITKWFLPRSETHWKTTIVRKCDPCRAAKQRVVSSSAAGRSQHAERYRPYC